MAEDKKEKVQIPEGYKPDVVPTKKGYQPTQSNLDTSNPPQGGSGVPASSDDSGESDKKD